MANVQRACGSCNSLICTHPAADNASKYTQLLRTVARLKAIVVTITVISTKMTNMLDAMIASVSRISSTICCHNGVIDEFVGTTVIVVVNRLAPGFYFN
jgi:hypothetical protein